MKKQSRAMVAVFCVVCIGFCAGCSKGKITADNYSKIKQGMTLSEVQDILGSEGKQTGTTIEFPDGLVLDAAGMGGVVYTWDEDGKSISVLFYEAPIDGPIPRARTASYKGL